jgi:hypothetical protein
MKNLMRKVSAVSFGVPERMLNVIQNRLITNLHYFTSIAFGKLTGYEMRFLRPMQNTALASFLLSKIDEFFFPDVGER